MDDDDAYNHTTLAGENNMRRQARRDTQDALQRLGSPTITTATTTATSSTTLGPALISPDKHKSIAKRALACVALICLVLGPVVLVLLMVYTVWGGKGGQEHTAVHQNRLSHHAFAPLKINYTHHLPLLDIPDGPSSFRPLSFATVLATSNDHLTLLHTLALSALPCALLDPSLSSAKSSYNPTQIWYTFSAATNASISLGNLDNYYGKLLPYYQQLLFSSSKSEQALRPSAFKGFLCTQKAWVKRYLWDTCLFKSDMEQYSRSKAWIMTVKDGMEGAKREKRDIAKKKMEVRKLVDDLFLFGTRIRKEERVGEDDAKIWFFQNVAQVGGQVWKAFDHEFGRLDCTTRDSAEVGRGAVDEDAEEEEEEDGRWNVEKIWAR